MADQPNQLNIRIVKFFSKPREEVIHETKMVPFPDGKGGIVMMETTDYRKTGKMVPEDWVAYAPPGGLDRAVTNMKISEIKKIKKSGANHHIAADTMCAFRDYILERYEMWKKGEEAPIVGTPLVAWNALDTEEVAAFKRAGIHTVEEIRDMSDTILSKVMVARPREKKALAARFLEAADQNRAAAEIKRRDEEMEALRAELAEMRKHIASAPPAKKTLTMPKQTEAAA